jgi:hypothetical protein
MVSYTATVRRVGLKRNRGREMTYDDANGPDPSREEDEFDLIPEEVACAYGKDQGGDDGEYERVVGRTFKVDVYGTDLEKAEQGFRSRAPGQNTSRSAGCSDRMLCCKRTRD